MNTIESPVFWIATTTLLVYIVGLITFIRGIIKYKYSFWWLIPALLLVVFPEIILQAGQVADQQILMQEAVLRR